MSSVQPTLFQQTPVAYISVLPLALPVPPNPITVPCIVSSYLRLVMCDGTVRWSTNRLHSLNRPLPQILDMWLLLSMRPDSRSNPTPPPPKGWLRIIDLRMRARSLAIMTGLYYSGYTNMMLLIIVRMSKCWRSWTWIWLRTRRRWWSWQDRTCLVILETKERTFAPLHSRPPGPTNQCKCRACVLILPPILTLDFVIRRRSY